MDMATVVALTESPSNDTYRCLYWGGPYFAVRDGDDRSATVLFRYPNGYPAVIGVTIGSQGGRVLLSGVHFEVTSQVLEHARSDFKLNDDHRPRLVDIMRELDAAEPERAQVERRLLEWLRK